jgi:sugar diacid utilization regulator
MLPTSFVFTLSKLIKESFQLESVITDEKAIILVSTYESEKPGSLDFTVLQLIKHLVNSEIPVLADESIIPIRMDGDNTLGYVHIKSSVIGDELSLLYRFIHEIFRYDVYRTELDNEPNDTEKLVNYMLSEITPETLHSIKGLAAKLNYDINHPMSVIVARTEENRASYFNMDLGYSTAIKVTKERILTEIHNNYSFNNRDICTFSEEGLLVIIKAFFSLEDLTSLYILLRKNVEQIDKILSKYKIFTYSISNGYIVDQFSKVRSSYMEALRNIEISQIIGLNSSVVLSEDILFEKLIDNFSVELTEMQIIPLIKKITKTGMRKCVELLNLYEQYCICNFNISETSIKFFLHRNTVAQKLEQLKKITGLDPFGGFNDRLLLKLLYSYINTYQLDRR